jgi:hypothetical protein
VSVGSVWPSRYIARLGGTPTSARIDANVRRSVCGVIRESWRTFLTSPRTGRRLPTKDINLEASRTALRRFAKAFGAQLSPASR